MPSGVQESHSSLAVSRNSAARVYRSARSRKPPRRKFSPVKASEEVTTFQAARPPLTWSRVANLRASSNGSLKVVLTVAASPRCSVTPAGALSTVIDSGRPTTSRSWIRPLCSRSRKPSARKKKSNSPRSAVRARCAKEENSIWDFDSGSVQTVVLLTPGKCAARCIRLRLMTLPRCGVLVGGSGERTVPHLLPGQFASATVPLTSRSRSRSGSTGVRWKPSTMPSPCQVAISSARSTGPPR